MKKFFKTLLFIVLGIIAFLLIAGLFLPKKFHVERSIAIQAPPALIMEQVKDLKKANEWSPWTELDPNMDIKYSGQLGQVGSRSEWKSKKAGSGSQTVLAVSETRLDTRIDFVEPFESSATTYFEIKPESNASKVTWAMEGDNPYPFNTMCLFMSMDKMIGKDYEKGLKKLKVRCEQMAPKAVVPSES